MALSSMFFSGYEEVFRTLIVGTITYILLVAILRITGKRTLSKLNAFDFIVTIALGSTVATILLSKDVALMEGFSALLLLVVLQLGITWISQRYPIVQRLIKAQPSIVFYRGKFQEKVMNKTRITKSEILQAMRSQGIASFGGVYAVILETNGELSVVVNEAKHDSTLSDVV